MNQPKSFTGLPNTSPAGINLDAAMRSFGQEYLIVEWNDGRLEVLDGTPPEDGDWAGWCRIASCSESVALALYYEAHDQWAAELNGDPDWMNCVTVPMEKRPV